MSIAQYAITLVCTYSCLFALKWDSNIDQSIKQAQKEQKPLLAYFSADWCSWCHKLDETFLKQPAFEKFAEDFVLVKILYPKNRQEYTPEQKYWRQKYNVSSFPTLVILDQEGAQLGSTGYPRDALEEYLAKLRHIAKLEEDKNR